MPDSGPARRFFGRSGASRRHPLSAILHSEMVGGTLALVAATAALLWANLGSDSYHAVREFHLGPLTIEHWAADGALTLFFFVAGLELAREFTVGTLHRFEDAIVPVVAAACGVMVPALVYVLVNRGTGNLGGWAIPSATDIAFALAVLAVAGPALPKQLRAFLLTLAVVDDLIVIAIIAVFYGDNVRFAPLLGSIALITIYGITQRARLTHPIILIVLGVAAWWLLYNSGVHATIAGAALGLLTRVRRTPTEQLSPNERLSHLLTPWSAGLAVPVFALMSAGVTLDTDALRTLASSTIAWGLAAGLIIGKPIGVLGGTWIVNRVTGSRMAPEVTVGDLLGLGIVTGIGFTVSLLVSDLAFGDHRTEEAKAAVLIGSLVAGVVGATVLRVRNAAHKTR